MKQLVIASLCIIIGGTVANYLRFVEPKPTRPPRFASIPMKVEGYSGTEQRFSQASYEILQADATTLREYYDESGNPLWLFVGYFSSQKYGSQIHSPKHCLPGSGWRIDQLSPYRLELPGISSKTVNRLIITERDHSELMLYWYETRGGTISNEFELKWDLMKNSLLLRPTDAAIIRLNLPLAADDNIESATRKAESYLRKLYPTIALALPFGN